LSEHHRIDGFDCGKPDLNVYLAERARESQRDGYARTYVISDADQLVVGYYSVCSSMISRNVAPRQIAGHGAPRDIPVILLARLAVDGAYQGLGLGGDLLKHAMQMATLSAERVGVRAMLVHALDDDAERFYRKYNFRPARELDRTLLRSLNDIATSLQVAREKP
jgi:GNAT superfamily N-acetyltransferase